MLGMRLYKLYYLLLDANLYWHRLGSSPQDSNRRSLSRNDADGIDRFPRMSRPVRQEQGEELWAEFWLAEIEGR